MLGVVLMMGSWLYILPTRQVISRNYAKLNLWWLNGDHQVSGKERLQWPWIRDHSPASPIAKVLNIIERLPFPIFHVVVKITWRWLLLDCKVAHSNFSLGQNYLKVARMDSQNPGGSTLGLVEQYLEVRFLWVLIFILIIKIFQFLVKVIIITT